jgi:hypothetical protein
VNISANRVVQGTRNLVTSHLEAHQTPDGVELVNTTGDLIDPKGMFLKSQTPIAQGKDGQDYVFIGNDAQGQHQWLAKKEFKEGGDLLYLPEVRPNKTTGIITGGLRGAITLAPLGPVGMAVGAGVGAGTGLVTQLLPTDKTPVKAGAGALIGAAALGTAGLLLGGLPAIAGMAVVGALLGAGSALAGDGKGKVRDASYAGNVLSAMVPGAGLALPVAAGLGAKAKKPWAQALLSAGLAAALTAGKIALLGGNPVAIGVAAAVGAVAPAVGRVSMNVIRNLSQKARKLIQKPLASGLKKLPDPALCAVAGLPLAFLGGSVGMIFGPPGILIGAAAGEALGSAKTGLWLHKLKEKEHQPAVPG